ncbi:hypothetical protein BDQ17DRAFT_1343990, partial [Cyathus striatus]
MGGPFPTLRMTNISSTTFVCWALYCSQCSLCHNHVCRICLSAGPIPSLTLLPAAA